MSERVARAIRHELRTAQYRLDPYSESEKVARAAIEAMFDQDDLNRIREWFNAITDTLDNYQTKADSNTYKKVMTALGLETEFDREVRLSKKK